jgi:Tfp pilus assembly protein PilN
MIEINLVPEHLRKKRKPRLRGPSQGLPRETVIAIIVGVVILVVCAHIFLQVLIAVRFMEYKKYAQEKESIVEQKTNVDRIVHELRRAQGNLKAIEKVIGDRWILWSQKLNSVSDNIPRGVWLTKITLEKDILRLEGSAVSKDKTEMINVHSLTSNLKNHNDFAGHFRSIELGLIKTRKIIGTVVADFTITATLR